jgi:catechol 2,3-dioxygenase
MAKRIDPRVEIGRVTLEVADLTRAIAFYETALGFEVAGCASGAALLAAGGRRHHIRLQTPAERGAAAAPSPIAIRYPDRLSLGDAVRRLRAAGVALDAAFDDGVSETVSLRDPDGHRLDLYRERPRAEWPRDADGLVRLDATPLDVDSLAAASDRLAAAAPVPHYAPMTEKMRQSLRELRTRLLQLHKVLLDDARAAYEMDRGRVGSNATLLQLVISDPWFAWLHSLSELVVRIDECGESDSPATDADAAALTEQVDRLLTASEDGEGFQRRYYEALQRQPAVVLAHADVKRALRGKA